MIARLQEDLQRGADAKSRGSRAAHHAVTGPEGEKMSNTVFEEKERIIGRQVVRIRLEFGSVPGSGVKEAIQRILTSAYEARVQKEIVTCQGCEN